MHGDEDDLQYYLKINPVGDLWETVCIWPSGDFEDYISIYAFHVMFLECADPAAVLFTVE